MSLFLHLAAYIIAQDPYGCKRENEKSSNAPACIIFYQQHTSHDTMRKAVMNPI